MIIDIDKIRTVIQNEFFDITTDTIELNMNLVRIGIIDGSYLDVWYSLKLEGKYSYHWERKAIDSKIYRHDNAIHKSWEHIKTFPKHFHNGSEKNVTESYISDDPETAIRQVLQFIQANL